MDIRNMATFLKVAELKSFSHAANYLGYSQSAVSTQIIKLEQELGYNLFDRIGHKIFLTDSGKLFMEYSQNVLQLSNNLKNQLEGQATLKGTIKIATSDSLCSSFFPDIFLRFKDTCPDVKIQIRSDLTDNMLKLLLNNDIDLVYTLDNKINRNDLTVVKESPESVSFYVSSTHPLATKECVTIDDIKKYPLYLTEEGVSYRRILDKILAEKNTNIEPTFQSENVEVIKTLILKTDGIGFIPSFVVSKEISSNLITPLNVDNINVTVWKQLIYHKGKVLSPAMKLFIETLV